MASKQYTREDLKRASLQKIKEQSKEFATGGFKDIERLPFEKGKNKVRVFPAHPESTSDLYAHIKSEIWMLTPKKDEDGELDWDNPSKRPFLNARIHAGQEKDVFEEFVKVGGEVIMSNNNLSAKEKASKIDIMGDFHKGCKHSLKFISYGKNASDEYGYLEWTNANKQKLDTESLSVIEEDPASPDIISDLDEGVIITVDYQPKKDNSKRYQITLARNPTPITDEDFEWIMSVPPLTETFSGSKCFNKKHFEAAMNALSLYDEEHELEVFESSEFQKIAKEIEEALDGGGTDDADEDVNEEEKEVVEAPKSKRKSRSSKPKKKTLGDLDEDELRQAVLDNKYDLRAMKKDSVEDILDKIESVTGLTADNFPDDPITEEGDEDEEYENPLTSDNSEEETEESKPDPRARRTRRTRD